MRLLFAFLLQWATTSLGLWLAVLLLGTSADLYNSEMEFGIFLTAGFVLSLINIFIRPVISLLSLPITLVTLGLFTLVINGFMVWLALQWTNGIEMTFFDSILAGVIIGIVNFVIGQLMGALKLGKTEKSENEENI